MTQDVSLLERIDRHIHSGEFSLPVVNQHALHLQSLASDDNYDIAEVERFIHADQALTAEVLRAANSPFFGGLSTIHTIRQAVARISMRQVARLVLMASERSKYDAKHGFLRGMIQDLWKHSTTTALAAQWLAHRLDYVQQEEECFLGGLMHDVGKLVILRAMDELTSRERGAFEPSAELIGEVLNSGHPRLGYELLKSWNIPDLYCTITRDHHVAEVDPSATVLLVVRLADLTANKAGIGLNPDPSLSPADTPEAACLGAGEILMAELEVMLEDWVSSPQAA